MMVQSLQVNGSTPLIGAEREPVSINFILHFTNCERNLTQTFPKNTVLRNAISDVITSVDAELKIDEKNLSCQLLSGDNHT